MKYLVIVTADPNDADYIGRAETVDERKLSLVRKVGTALKAHRGGHNWGRQIDIDRGYDTDPKVKYADSLTPDEIDEFDENFVPCDDMGEGVHTIERIIIIPAEAVERVL